MQFLKRVAHLIQQHPTETGELLPLLRTAVSEQGLAREARSFGTREEMEKYLKEHPKADKSKHHVTEKNQGVARETAKNYKQDISALKSESPKAVEEIARHLSKLPGGFGAASKDQIKHHEMATDKLLKKWKLTPKDLSAFKKSLDPKTKAAITQAVKAAVPDLKEAPKDWSPAELKEYKSKRKAIQESLGDYMALQLSLKTTSKDEEKREKRKKPVSER